jgi:hypothetical protein
MAKQTKFYEWLDSKERQAVEKRIGSWLGYTAAMRAIWEAGYIAGQRPTCEQCDEELNPYTDPATGKDCWGCDRCGWSEDNNG